MQSLMLALLLLAFSSFAADTPPRLPSAASKPQFPPIHGKAECLAQKGKWGWQGIPHQEEPDDFQGMCIRATTDAGKSCSNSAECQGLCIATATSAKSGRGVCAQSNFNAGCRSTVERGVASPVVCVD